jgi:hypothetical protein
LGAMKATSSDLKRLSLQPSSALSGRGKWHDSQEFARSV